MLQSKYCGGHKDCRLHTVRNAFENSSERDLGFAETDISAQKAVHGIRFFHIALDFSHTAELILGFAVFKTRLEIALHIDIG